MFEIMRLEEYWWPVRLGLRVRRILRAFQSSYGGRFFKIRRPLAVFLNTLLDIDHQETYKGTVHNRFI